jgi:putative nucleotidyltransferase with HDIG domain
LNKLLNDTGFAHSKQVAEISALLAAAAGYSEDETALIKQAALYHDIGKMDIPSAILNKPGKLTPEEFEIVKTHTALGHKEILETIEVLAIAARVCREHHERIDGTGYCQISGGDIHPYAKLIAAADVFDALFSQRSYKAAWDIRQICEYFREQSGKQFDCEIVKLLLSAIDAILPLYNSPKNV